MPKCNRCPIIAECKKTGKIVMVHADGRKIEICPLLWALQTLIRDAIKESKEVKKVETVNSVVETVKSSEVSTL